MRVAVTGATGVIGSVVVPFLVASGHDVVGLARTPEKARFLEGLGASAARISLFDGDGLAAMFDGADAVCNLATHMPVGLAGAAPCLEGQRPAARRGLRRMSRPHATPESAVWSRRASRSCTPTRATSGSPRTARSRSPAPDPARSPSRTSRSTPASSRVGVVLRFGTSSATTR